MNNAQRISMILIALILFIGILGMSQLGALQVDASSGYEDTSTLSVFFAPPDFRPNVSWNSRIAWYYIPFGPGMNVSWNS